MTTRFFDTNVLAYLASADASKSDVAQSLLAAGGVISVQVLNELANVSRRKMGLSWPETQEFLSMIRAFMRVEPLTHQTHELGLALAERHGFSIYDAMILSAGLIAGCDVLLSEDMQHDFIVGARMTISNPFLLG